VCYKKHDNRSAAFDHEREEKQSQGSSSRWDLNFRKVLCINFLGGNGIEGALPLLLEGQMNDIHATKESGGFHSNRRADLFQLR
jgi:hypothetical protein